MTLGLVPGRFFRDARLHCLNLLLTYDKGCNASCAYCGLQKTRQAGESKRDHSFIRVDWPIVSLDEIISRMGRESCSHVERVCVSMITNRRAREDTLDIVRRLREKTISISGLIAPTIIDKGWLSELKKAGVDKVGIAVDTATPELFQKFRGRDVGGPHKWEKYWQTLQDSVEIFGRFEASIHLMVGLGETERETVETVQKVYDMGALTHLFSFFAEEGSMMQDHLQPPVGKYRRVQLARYMINKGMGRIDELTFDDEGKIVDFGINKAAIDKVVNSGLPFMTSGCSGKNMENACNRPFSNCTPYQAYVGELRNYPFTPLEEDTRVIRQQLGDYSEVPTRVWVEGLGCGERDSDSCPSGK